MPKLAINVAVEFKLLRMLRSRYTLSLLASTKTQRTRKIKKTEMGSGHILALPYPAQGHVSLMMNLCHEMAEHGFKITFVNTDFNHERVVSAMVEKGSPMGSKFDFVSIPDGLDPEDERNDFDFPKLCQSMLRTMPEKLEELVRGINASTVDDKITCFVAEFGMGWALEIANKMGIRGALYWPLSAAATCGSFRARKPEQEKVLNCARDETKGHATQLSEDMSAEDKTKMLMENLATGNLETIMNTNLPDYGTRLNQAMKMTDWWLCNSAYELEPDEFAQAPNLLPIGPLLPKGGNSRAQFLAEDSSCLNWLDQQPPRSVIYVAFGSISNLEPIQFQELALGLELTNRPFLWAVRPNMVSCAYPNEFKGTRGKIVGWVPQPKVLSHPSVACFLSHCGWNSTNEGLSSGVPFLCLPLFSDQPMHTGYICNVWKVGLGLDSDENGIVRRNEIKKKVEQLLSDENIRARSLQLKTTIMNTTAGGGQSSKNFNNFINWLRE